MKVWEVLLTEQDGSAGHTFITAANLHIAEHKARKMFGRTVAQVSLTGFASLDDALRGGGDSDARDDLP